MQNQNYTISIGAIVLLVLLYFAWPYFLGVLALIGALHLYRLWRLHYRR
jgi:hypothetical protein